MRAGLGEQPIDMVVNGMDDRFAEESARDARLVGHDDDAKAGGVEGTDRISAVGIQLDALRPMVTGALASLRSIALRFVLANQIVSSAVLGPRSVAQLDQLVREAGMPPYLHITALAELSGRLKHAGIEV